MVSRNVTSPVLDVDKQTLFFDSGYEAKNNTGILLTLSYHVIVYFIVQKMF